jgi:nitrogen regulatory protein PII
VQHSAVKQVIAVVKPFLAERVLEGLKLAPLEALNVREVKGFNRQKSYLDEYGENEYAKAFLPKVEITMWVDDARVEEIVRRVVDVARTGRMGDGKIFVLSADFFDEVLDIAAAGGAVETAEHGENGKSRRRAGIGKRKAKS